MQCSICNKETSILNFVSVYEPMMCKQCRPDLIKPNDTGYVESNSNMLPQPSPAKASAAYGTIFGWSLMVGAVLSALGDVADDGIGSGEKLITGMLIMGILLAIAVTTVYWIVKSFGQSGEQGRSTESDIDTAIDSLSPSIVVMPSDSLSEELQALADLKEKGVLSDDEFQQAKAKLLSK
ncbi:SHOCT domain-containing protein [Candidatus Lucifugimonas marina]